MNDPMTKLLLALIIVELGWTMVVTTKPAAILMGAIFVITGVLAGILIIITRRTS